MADAADSGTKTVRIAAHTATKLQTIATLKEQMGEKFKPVEFLNGLVESPIDDLYESTTRAFTEFLAQQQKRGRKKS